MNRTTLTTVLICIAAIALAACVRSGTYDKAKKKLATCETDRDAATGKLKEERKKNTKLVADVTKMTERAESAEKQKSTLQGELASLVKDKAKLEASAQELKQALAETRERKAQAEKRVSEFRNLLAKFKALIDAGKLKVKIVDGRMVLALPTDVLFGSGSANLSDVGKQAIADVAQVLATIPGRRFQIEGHTDNVPIKTRKYPSNWDLAAARALNVAAGMRDAGMPGGSVSAASFGEYRPTTSNDTNEGREANRRIEIVLVPDLSALPGFEELKTAVGS